MLLIICAWPRAPATLGGPITETPAPEVRVGFGGVVKIGVPVPVHVVIPPLPFAGGAELIVDAPAVGPQVGRVVASSVIPFQAVPGAARAFDIPVVVNDSRRPLAVIVAINGREVLRREISIPPERVSDRLLVALSDEQAGLASLRRPPLGVVTSYITGDTLPRRWQEYGAVDLLVIRDLEAAALGRTQQEALLTWVRLGGRLLLIARPGSRLAALDSILPAAAGEAHAVDSLSTLSLRYGGAFPPGPYPLVALQPRPGTRVIAQDKVPLIVSRREGAGKVTIWAFDPWLPSYLEWGGRLRLWDETIGAGAPAAVDPDALAEQLPASTPLDPLAHAAVGGAIVLYIAALMWCVRRWPTRAGAALGLVIVAFGVAGFALLADLTRARSAALIEATVLQPAEGTGVARATTVASVAVPYGGRYRVTAPPAVFATPVAPASDLKAVLTADGTVLTGTLRAGEAPRALLAVSAASIVVSAWLSADNRRLTIDLGSLRLQDAELRWHDRLVVLGDLPPGRSVMEISADAWAAAANDGRTRSEFSSHLRDGIFRGPTGDAILNGTTPVLDGELQWPAPVFVLDGARAPGRRLTILLAPLDRR